MSKIYLGLEWTNHVQVTRAGGKKVTRDEKYSELVESQDLLGRILSRVRRAHGAENPLVNIAFKDYHADVKQAQKTGKPVKRTVTQGTRKLFTYEISVLITKFVLDGATYMIREDGQIVHVGGVRPWVGDKTKVKVHSGLTDEEALAEGIDRKALSAKAAVKGKTPKEIIEDKAKQAKDAVTDDTPPFSLIDEKPSDITAVKFTNGQKKALRKCGLPTNALPATQPKGITNKVWKDMQVRAGIN